MRERKWREGGGRKGGRKLSLLSLLSSQELRSQLQDRLKLADYLILPVQRITKYTLLLMDFQKHSVRSAQPAGQAEAALSVTRGISTQANNAIHLSMLERVVKIGLGELVLQVGPVCGACSE